jgi:hypothetical protein
VKVVGMERESAGLEERNRGRRLQKKPGRVVPRDSSLIEPASRHGGAEEERIAAFALDSGERREGRVLELEELLPSLPVHPDGVPLRRVRRLRPEPSGSHSPPGFRIFIVASLAARKRRFGFRVGEAEPEAERKCPRRENAASESELTKPGRIPKKKRTKERQRTARRSRSRKKPG